MERADTDVVCDALLGLSAAILARPQIKHETARPFGCFDGLAIHRMTPLLLADDPTIMCAAAKVIRAVVAKTKRPVLLTEVQVALETLVALYRAGLPAHPCLVAAVDTIVEIVKLTDKSVPDRPSSHLIRLYP